MSRQVDRSRDTQSRIRSMCRWQIDGIATAAGHADRDNRRKTASLPGCCALALGFAQSARLMHALRTELRAVRAIRKNRSVQRSCHSAFPQILADTMKQHSTNAFHCLVNRVDRPAELLG